jgi:hypothetical protein
VFLDPSFPVQSAFIADPAKLKVVLCTQRSGKSYGAGLYLYREAYETPGASCIYIALTRDSAKKIMWKDVLKPINRQLRLGTRFNETELTATLPNGSIIYVLGVDSTGRYCHTYLSEVLAPAPKPGTTEWFEQEAREMEEAEVQRYLELQAERREAEEWGLGWKDPRPEPISYRSFTQSRDR